MALPDPDVSIMVSAELQCCDQWRTPKKGWGWGVAASSVLCVVEGPGCGQKRQSFAVALKADLESSACCGPFELHVDSFDSWMCTGP